MLTGNCALCVVVSTQRYWIEDLMPIHPGCDCSVRRCNRGMERQQVIDQDLLDRAHAALGDVAGTTQPTHVQSTTAKSSWFPTTVNTGPSWGGNKPGRKDALDFLAPPTRTANALKGTVIPKNESRKLTITEEFCLKVLRHERNRWARLWNEPNR